MQIPILLLLRPFLNEVVVRHNIMLRKYILFYEQSLSILTS